MTKENGGQAFPTHPAIYSSVHSGQARGMTLRDWFAGQVLAGVVQVCAKDTRGSAETAEDFFAQRAYAIADAMIRMRDR